MPSLSTLKVKDFNKEAESSGTNALQMLQSAYTQKYVNLFVGSLCLHGGGTTGNLSSISSNTNYCLLDIHLMDARFLRRGGQASQASPKQPPDEPTGMEGLSDSDLKTLLQNFKDLSSDEQHGLIAYLKKLEFKEPKRVEKLRKFVNLDPERDNLGKITFSSFITI